MQTEADKARKWKSELQLAGRREDPWRKKAKGIIERYRGEQVKRNSFNILWANTEILRPAIYNSRPTPDVRRRFRDADPLGKAVSEVMERCLNVVVDDCSFDYSIKNDVLDSLLPGRGVTRWRYIPKIASRPAPSGAAPAQDGADTEATESDKSDDVAVSDGAVEEELEYERVVPEHVDWQDFRHGYGRVWEEVDWIGFRHTLTKTEAADKFGEDALKGIEFTQPEAPNEKRKEVVTETRKVAEFWEIWDKATETVFFTQDKAEQLLYPKDTPNGEPPLALMGFYPLPEPLKIIENTGTLDPVPIYTLYEQQANELDKISNRINKIVDACKVRGIYDAKMKELAGVLAEDDNGMTPVQNAAAWATQGGLEKAISWMPVDQAAKVLEILGNAREQAKATIYEITGISDIIRGATMASETATAQQIKANYASVRLQRMQHEVQRYVRDHLRIAGEIIANKFVQPTLAAMTGLQFPTEMQKQMAQQQAQVTGQPPDPAMMQLPTWEQIIQVLRNDLIRGYKIDVETDSTVAGSLESDMQGLSQLVQGLGSAMQVFAPAVQMGFLPLEAAKEIVLALTRRAKLGIAVEDSLEKMQQPPPPPQEQQQPDHSLDIAQLNAQKDAQLAQLQTQHEQAMEAAKQQAENQRLAMEKQHEAQIEQMRVEAENMRHASQLETQRMIADAANQTNLMIADMKGQQAASAQANQLAADQQKQETQIAADSQKQATDVQSKADLASMKAASTDAPPAADYKDVESSSKLDAHIEAINKLLPVMSEAVFHMSRPKKIVRDANGKIAGVE